MNLNIWGDFQYCISVPLTLFKTEQTTEAVSGISMYGLKHS